MLSRSAPVETESIIFSRSTHLILLLPDPGLRTFLESLPVSIIIYAQKNNGHTKNAPWIQKDLFSKTMTEYKTLRGSDVKSGIPTGKKVKKPVMKDAADGRE